MLHEFSTTISQKIFVTDSRISDQSFPDFVQINHLSSPLNFHEIEPMEFQNLTCPSLGSTAQLSTTS